MNASTSYVCPECSKTLAVSDRAPLDLDCHDCGAKLSLVSKCHLENYLPSFLFRIHWVTVHFFLSCILTLIVLSCLEFSGALLDYLVTIFICSQGFVLFVIQPVYELLLTEKELTLRKSSGKTDTLITEDILERYVPSYVLGTCSLLIFFPIVLTSIVLGTKFLNMFKLDPTSYFVLITLILFVFASILLRLYSKLFIRPIPLVSSSEPEDEIKNVSKSSLAMQALHGGVNKDISPDTETEAPQCRPHSFMMSALVISFSLLLSWHLSDTYLRPYTTSIEMKVNCSKLSEVQIRTLQKETQMI